MTLARYPNIGQNGLWNFTQVAKVINNGTFQFSDSRYVHTYAVSMIYVRMFLYNTRLIKN